MNNQLALKNLNKIKNISIALFFIQLLIVIFSITIPIVLTFSLSTYPPTIPVNIEPFHALPLDPTIISVVIVPLILGITFLIVMPLTITNLVFACQTKINNESITIIIVFAALGFVLFTIAPLVLWILSSKYKKIAEDEITKENKNIKVESVQVQI